jgi:hypothetical protein
MDGITPSIRPPVGQSIGVSETGQPLDFRPRKFWARIGSTRTANKYSWSPAFVKDDGTLDVVTDSYGGEVIQGTPDAFPAVEVSGSTGVAPNSIQELVASDRGPWFEFREGGGSDNANEFVIIGFVCDDSGYLIPNYDIRNAAAISISGIVTNDGTPVSGVTITGSVNTPGNTLTTGTIATTGSDGKYSGVVSPYRVVNVTTGLNQFFVQATAGSSYTPNPAKISIVPAPSSITQNFTV